MTTDPQPAGTTTALVMTMHKKNVTFNPVPRQPSRAPHRRLHGFYETTYTHGHNTFTVRTATSMPDQITIIAYPQPPTPHDNP